MSVASLRTAATFLPGRAAFIREFTKGGLVKGGLAICVLSFCRYC